MVQYTEAAQEIVDAFNEVPVSSKLELLLEYANSLPAIPERYADHPELLERVEECQSPVYLFVEVGNGKANIFLTAPAEAPTTRGFASLLQLALDGQNIDTIIAFSDQFIQDLKLSELVSPLRIRGMHGMLTRIKRQVQEKSL
ncbi:MAG: SufE family protein [Micrococcales bacterium]|nr:SufE family protein [Microbacteriaceae bacterium]NBR22524.1 SufE family protein [Micrococcales bacterium]NBS60643.1 SufE family protein [Microbacteriaceae bacterium]NBS85862.1 SufE family protein [Micrococcales bacterium]